MPEGTTPDLVERMAAKVDGGLIITDTGHRTFVGGPALRKLLATALEGLTLDDAISLAVSLGMEEVEDEEFGEPLYEMLDDGSGAWWHFFLHGRNRVFKVDADDGVG